jgi:hypothetical protein
VDILPTPNPCRTNTKGIKEWFETLKRRWDLKYTVLRDSEERMVITHTQGGKNSGRIILVGEHDRKSGNGYILDRRKEIR